MNTSDGIIFCRAFLFIDAVLSWMSTITNHLTFCHSKIELQPNKSYYNDPKSQLNTLSITHFRFVATKAMFELRGLIYITIQLLIAIMLIN